MTLDDSNESTGTLDPAEPLLTPKQLAKYLGVSERTLRRWCVEGRLKAIRIGRTVRFRLSGLEHALHPDDAENADVATDESPVMGPPRR